MKTIAFIFTLLAVAPTLAFAAEEGTVKWYNEIRGVGAITPKGLPHDFFFATEAIDESYGPIQYGCRVSFEVESEVKSGGDDHIAVNIRRLSCP